MGGPVVKEEKVDRPANWQNYLGQIVKGISDEGSSTPFEGGTKTMRHREMDSQNKRHSQTIAQQDRQMAQSYRMHQESMALQRWSEQQRYELAWAEFDLAKQMAQQKASAQTSGLSGDDLLAALTGGAASGTEEVSVITPAEESHSYADIMQNRRNQGLYAPGM